MNGKETKIYGTSIRRSDGGSCQRRNHDDGRVWGWDGTYWLTWTASGGFTDTGWETAWGSSNVPLSGAWTNNPAAGYGNTYEDFIAYVSTGIDNLDPWLDGYGWSSEAKWAFIQENPNIFMNCTTPT